MFVSISFVTPIVLRVDLLNQFLPFLHMSIWCHSSDWRGIKGVKFNLLCHILGHVLALVICICFMSYIHDASEPIVGNALNLLKSIIDLRQITWFFLLKNGLLSRSFLIILSVDTSVNFLSRMSGLRISSMIYSLFQLVGQLSSILAHSTQGRTINIHISQSLRSKSSLDFIVNTSGRDLDILPIKFVEYLYIFVSKFVFHFFTWVVFIMDLNELAVFDFRVNPLFEFLKSLRVSLLVVHKIIDHGVNQVDNI